MHTTQIDHEGWAWIIHHNGDFSGNARIQVPFTRVMSGWDKDVRDVDIPIAVLKELLGRHLQARAISQIEQTSGADYLDSMVE